MPRGDGTGPNGMGSMTGRAAGYCAGSETPGHANPTAGRNNGIRGRGGRGRRNMFYAAGTPGGIRNNTVAVPNRETVADTEGLQQQLAAINKRLSEIEKNMK
ncbi:MAG: DUF5320 domain-containing protein [Candidatus Hydrogenedentes bacterium]|nr:DUF5320 domain-containing protein [Candidatus Hydrogenedentota bacterium]